MVGKSKQTQNTIKEINERIGEFKSSLNKSIAYEKESLSKSKRKLYNLERIGSIYENTWKKSDEEILSQWSNLYFKGKVDGDTAYKNVIELSNKIASFRKLNNLNSQFDSSKGHGLISNFLTLVNSRKMKKNLYDLLNDISEEDFAQKVIQNKKIPTFYQVNEKNFSSWNSDELYNVLTNESNWKRNKFFYGVSSALKYSRLALKEFFRSKPKCNW